MIKKSPKISIVTPSYNQGNFLEATIQSILSQNYPNLEFIIIDGGSTDNSVEVIKKYEKHISYWCSEPDQGQYHAINKGFTHSSGEIMAWLNSDDMYYPWTFKTVASIMSELPEVDWLTTLYAGWWDYQGFSTGFNNFSGFSKAAFLDGCYLPWNKKSIGWIQQESTFWRRSLWEKSGAVINTDYKLAADFDLWSKFYRYAELYGVSSPLGGFRGQGNQRSTQRDIYISEALNSLEKFRETELWSSDLYKSFLKNIKISKIPKVRDLLLPSIAYKGKRIVRVNGRLPSGSWGIENYSFFDQITFRK